MWRVANPHDSHAIISPYSKSSQCRNVMSLIDAFSDAVIRPMIRPFFFCVLHLGPIATLASVIAHVSIHALLVCPHSGILQWVCRALQGADRALRSVPPGARQQQYTWAFEMDELLSSGQVLLILPSGAYSSMCTSCRVSRSLVDVSVRGVRVVCVACHDSAVG